MIAQKTILLMENEVILSRQSFQSLLKEFSLVKNNRPNKLLNVLKLTFRYALFCLDHVTVNTKEMHIDVIHIMV